MNLQNEMRRIQLTNLEHKAKSLRLDIERLCKTICINLDCGLTKPEDMPIVQVDSQWDELKSKWADLTVALEEIRRIKEELR